MSQNLRELQLKLNAGASLDVTKSVQKTQFGDGYAQRVSFGINNKRQVWSGSKTGDFERVIKPIMAFIDEHKGVKPFFWVTPHGERLKFTCDGYSISQRKGNFWQISLKLEQAF